MDKDNLERRGRKPKLKSGAMSAAERKQAERERRRARGEMQMWLTPDEVAVIEEMRKENAVDALETWDKS
jgi:uncharacterized protein YacL (UPF0231 family)